MYVVAYNVDVAGKRLSRVKPCLRCQREFHPFNGRFDTQKYCSRACGEQPRNPIKYLNREQAAWMAALVDGEGNVMVQTRARYRNRIVRITITNTCLELLERVKDWTGVGFIAVTTYDNPRHRTRYNWIVSGANAKALLRVMQPWLIVKREVTRDILDESGPAHWREEHPEAFVA